MAVFKRDMTFNELFIIPIRGLYADCSISIDEFKERNSALLKDKWVDTSHGENGEKIYQLFDTTSEGDLVKESLQEWLCDNRNEMTNCISITLRNHEMTYADWFRYVEAKSGPDELALYSLSRKHGVHTAVFNKSYVWTTLSEHIHRTDEEIFELCGVTLVFLKPTVYGILKKIRAPDPLHHTVSTTRAAVNPKTSKSDKVTCRSSIRGKKVNINRGRGSGRGRGKTARTLSDSREENFGITPTTAPRTSRRARATIDYLSLNDGLDDEQPTSPKRKKKPNYRPRREPTSSRVASQRISFLTKAKNYDKVAGDRHTDTLSGVPTGSTDRSGVQIPSTDSTTLPGVPLKAVAVSCVSVPISLTTEDALSGVPSSSITEDALSGIPPATTGNTDEFEKLPDLVVNSRNPESHR